MQVGSLRPFRIDVPQVALDDLKDRLARTRWPEKETVDDWDQGVPLAYARELAAYWRDAYDWRRVEARLNALPNSLVEVDGLDIHFLHIRSANPDARPLVLTHGWPGSVLEFLDVIEPLSADYHSSSRRFLDTAFRASRRALNGASSILRRHGTR